MELTEKLTAAEEKINKAKSLIEKRQKSLQKLYKNYEKETKFHKYLSPKVFANFRVFDDGKAGNPEATNAAREMMSVSHQLYCDLTWDWIDKGDTYVCSIAAKQDEIKLLEEKIADIKNRIAEKDAAELKVKTLFEEVPELDAFINTCGERQYKFLMERNEQLIPAWAAYNKAMDEACAFYNGYHEGMSWAEKNKKYNEMYYAAKAMQPKIPVQTEEQIRKDVEWWKHNERIFLADRIEAEFGKVLKTAFVLGDDGNVNGVIVGSLKTATCETIWAGGYNIQCLHTRFLVHEK